MKKMLFFILILFCSCASTSNIQDTDLPQSYYSKKLYLFLVFFDGTSKYDNWNPSLVEYRKNERNYVFLSRDTVQINKSIYPVYKCEETRRSIDFYCANKNILLEFDKTRMIINMRSYVDSNTRQPSDIYRASKPFFVFSDLKKFEK